jgi:hypothetical protein
LDAITEVWKKQLVCQGRMEYPTTIVPNSKCKVASVLEKVVIISGEMGWMTVSQLKSPIKTLKVTPVVAQGFNFKEKLLNTNFIKSTQT